MADLYDELEFPLRAEYLDQYKDYQVDIGHWKQLAEQFQKTFRQVYARRSAAVLLVYGPQGSGKSMFSARLKQDYLRTRAGAYAPDLRNNLWHVLVATDNPDEQTIRDATGATALELVNEHKEQQWLTELKSFAVKDQSRVRVILCDDAHKDSMTRPWTDLTLKEFYEARQSGPDAILAHVAERLNDACRHEFQRSIFVMLSNDKSWIEALRSHLERWFKDLATVLMLPVPEPPTLEHIVRINTNRLNRVSYWYCLDAANANYRKEVRRVLMEGSGFTDSFHAVSRSLDSESRRTGRPGNPNVLTLVTLGSEFAAVKTFLDDREITPEPFHGQTPHHLGVWDMRSQWASKMVRRPDRDFLRRARMLESEFMLRWVSLDMVATCALLDPPKAEDLGSELMALILRRPSIGTTIETRTKWKDDCAALDKKLDSAPFSAQDVERLVQELKRLGQRRSTLYEPAIRLRVGSASSSYGRGFAVHSSLRPDLIVEDSDAPGFGQYKICALTEAATDGAEDIAAAIRRTGHSVEITAFLSEDLEGLEGYLRDKIGRYAGMLESV